MKISVIIPVYNVASFLPKCLDSVYAQDLDGVEVSCSFNHDRVTSREIFYYNEMDAATVSSAFVEAGGTYPEFKNGQNIDKIEDIMKNSGYDCKRVG